jgi:drug/metabolite transporter (DMT)-like permease
MFYLVAAAVLWSTSGLFIKIIGWQPLSILSGRSLIAAIIFWFYLQPVRWRWSRLQMLGAGSYVCTQLFFIMATQMTTAANAIFLQYTLPVYVMVLGYWFLGERPSRADWVSLAAIVLGMVLFFGDDLAFSGWAGNLLAILSGMTMALLVLSLRKQKDGVPAHTLLLGNIIGALAGFPWLIQENGTFAGMGIIFYLGTLQIGLSFVLYSIAIKYVRALESTLILTLEPILNPLWVFLVVGEVPGAMAAWGGLLVIVAVAGRAVAGRKEKSP